jgi:hypothetical protein
MAHGPSNLEIPYIIVMVHGHNIHRRNDMTAIRYNPLTYSEKLKSAGMDEKVAKVIAQQQEEILAIHDENHATKNDLALSEKVLRKDIETLGLTMTIKVGAMMVVQSGLTIAILEFLKH